MSDHDITYNRVFDYIPESHVVWEEGVPHRYQNLSFFAGCALTDDVRNARILIGCVGSHYPRFPLTVNLAAILAGTSINMQSFESVHSSYESLFSAAIVQFLNGTSWVRVQAVDATTTRLIISLRNAHPLVIDVPRHELI